MKNKSLQNKYQYEDLLVKSQDPYANSKYDILLSWLRKYKVRTILNAGCGSGEFCFILANLGYNVVGIDPDSDYIGLANKELSKTQIKNCVFEISSIENYKQTNKFDAIIATDVLEHIEDDKTAFKKLASFVKIKGLILCTVPAGQYLFGYHDKKLGHFRRYSLSSFSEIVSKETRTLKLRYFGFFLIPIVFILSKWVKKSYPVAKSNNNFILNIILTIEKKIQPILGASVLFLGQKN